MRIMKKVNAEGLQRLPWPMVKSSRMIEKARL